MKRISDWIHHNRDLVMLILFVWFICISAMFLIPRLMMFSMETGISIGRELSKDNK